MKCNYLNLTFYCVLLISLTSCAQEIKNIPEYDFNRNYDMNKIITSYKNIDRPDINKILEIINKNTLIGFSWIDSPLDQITLFKNDNVLCAIRIINFKRGRDEKPPTSFESGKESFSAKYEMVTFSLKEKAIVGNEKLVITHGNLTNNSTFGLGRLAFGGGDSNIKCGNEKLHWSFPTAISILNRDSKMKFSPTNVNSFNLVDFDNYNNAWYGYEENRKMILLPLQIKNNN